VPVQARIKIGRVVPERASGIKMVGMADTNVGARLDGWKDVMHRKRWRKQIRDD